MKKIIVIIGISCLPLLALTGPTDLKNEVKLAERQASIAVKADPNYLSSEAYIAAVTSANNVNDLKTILLKKEKSEKAKERIKQESSEKVKKGK